MAHIYKITNSINDRGYVGKTENEPKKRWKEHLAAARNNPIMVISKAIRKYGSENFKFEIIEECLSEDVNKKETYWIGRLDTFKNGYNSTLGGEGIVGAIRERGAVHPHAKAVDCYDLEGNYLCTYNSKGEAAWEIARSNHDQSINCCIEGKTFQSFGHRWALKGEPLKEVNNRVNRKGKVYGIYLKSGRKKMWKSQADAAEEIEGNRKANNSLMQALVRNDKPETTKAQVKGWYVFRDRKIALGDWKPAERHIPTHEQAAKAGRMSKGAPQPSKWKAIKGVNIKTGEVVRFKHSREAVEKLRSDNCKISQSGIFRMIKILEKGKTHYSITNSTTIKKPYQHAGYRWYYEEVDQP
jgi:hypothetical protein